MIPNLTWAGFPGTAKMPPLMTEFPPGALIFSKTITLPAFAFLASAAAARPANPEPTTITSTSSSHFAGIGSLHAAFAVTDIKEEVANRAEEDKNFLLLRVFMIFSLENNKLWI